MGGSLEVILPIVLVFAAVFALSYFVFSVVHRRKSDGRATENAENIEKAKERYGEIGELTVASVLLESNADGRARLINNLTFENGTGRSTEIDHVFINENGVWLIETKRFSGEIFGDDGAETWRRVKRSGEVTTFRNPVMQSEGHERSVRRALNDRTMPMFSIVVFAEGNLTGVHSRKTFPLCDLKRLVQTRQKNLLSDRKIEETHRRFLRLQQEMGVDRAQHLRNVKNARNTQSVQNARRDR